MPRYCAVKACRNRGGTASRQDNKRISFYPFPLQDKPRLQKWVDNMKREDWTPSRHQYLCSEHFTKDCFDIRWGIRYLKNTAIPTIFPPTEDDGDNKVTAIKRNSKSKPNTSNSDNDNKGCDSPLDKRPLILSRASKKVMSNTTNGTSAEQCKLVMELPLVSDAVISCHSNQSELQTAACETAYDSRIQTPSAYALSPFSELQSEDQSDSSVTVLCCEPLGPFTDGVPNGNTSALHAALGQAFSFVPMEIVNDGSTDCFLEDGGPFDGEHISVYEHSYCRSNSSNDQLWSRILSLHSKILELDHREEDTVAKIRALENEITLLKRDGAVFKEKQKVLEDFITSVLI